MALNKDQVEFLATPKGNTSQIKTRKCTNWMECVNLIKLNTKREMVNERDEWVSEREREREKLSEWTYRSECHGEILERLGASGGVNVHTCSSIHSDFLWITWSKERQALWNGPDHVSQTAKVPEQGWGKALEIILQDQAILRVADVVADSAHGPHGASEVPHTWLLGTGETIVEVWIECGKVLWVCVCVCVCE